jgi:hypothetical protein
MSFQKHWTATGDKEMLRTKPYIGSNDILDELNEQAAEHKRVAHEAGECRENCAHCEADREARHYQRTVFDRFHDVFVTNFKKGVGRP